MADTFCVYLKAVVDEADYCLREEQNAKAAGLLYFVENMANGCRGGSLLRYSQKGLPFTREQHDWIGTVWEWAADYLGELGLVRPSSATREELARG